ncbi:AimR family lysis-lysogeny pheromone receptor [Shouchella rhizosphaerae]|uniref:AimR family lysis-lysogeny pheromone receptor n=1 Tax=Shouchella rhizosphaerae TaxID=866786 RepID=A0ABZ2CWF7_9BACI|nr:AimR family lysis-lysogeny pheromone receptor [Psychrobacillus sp. MER TA 17]
MESVINKLKEEMINKGIRQVDIVNATELNKSYVSKVLKNTIEPSFSQMFSIINFVSPKNYYEILDDFARRVQIKDNVLSAFEYASYFCRNGLLSELIDTHRGNKKEFEEYAIVYELANNREANRKELCREVFGTLKSPEMKVKVLLVEAVDYYSSGEVSLALGFSNKIKESLESINNTFFSEALETRLFGMLANALLYHKSDVEGARKYSRLVLENSVSSLSARVSATHILAHSYIFDNYDQSIEYFKRACVLYSDFNESMVGEILTNEIPFLKNVHGVPLEIGKDVVCTEELLHFHVRQGNREEAYELLNSAHLEKDSPYVKAYIGTLEKDFTKLLESQVSLIDRGNRFFIKVVECLARTIN